MASLSIATLSASSLISSQKNKHTFFFDLFGSRDAIEAIAFDAIRDCDEL